MALFSFGFRPGFPPRVELRYILGGILGNRMQRASKKKLTANAAAVIVRLQKKHVIVQCSIERKWLFS